MDLHIFQIQSLSFGSAPKRDFKEVIIGVFLRFFLVPQHVLYTLDADLFQLILSESELYYCD